MKSGHLAAVLVAYLFGVALLRLRVRSCGCDDLAAFDQPCLFLNVNQTIINDDTLSATALLPLLKGRGDGSNQR